MKTTFAALIALGASFAAADFIVYSSSETNYGTNGNDRGFKVFDGEPDCDDVSNTKFYMSWNDVSGKDAFRCKGSGCNHSEGDEIDELEMNFSGNSEPKIHLSMFLSWLMHIPKYYYMTDMEATSVLQGP